LIPIVLRHHQLLSSWQTLLARWRTKTSTWWYKTAMRRGDRRPSSKNYVTVEKKLTESTPN